MADPKASAAAAAVGMFFLPTNPDKLAKATEIIEKVLKNSGFALAGWRDVPTVPQKCEFY